MRRLAAATVTASLLAVAPAALAAESVTAERLFGDDRYDTARVIADDTFGDVAVAVLASGANFPDALAAAYMAGGLRAPVILTEPARLTPAARQALEAVQAEGVVIVGGTAAVNSSVEEELQGLGYEVDRVRGGDRYATARAIAESLPEENIGSLDSTVGRTAIVATGEKFPDALAGGSIAYDFGFPILLTPSNVLSEDASIALDNLDIREVVLLGGTAAISDGVADDIEDKGIKVRRVFGADRTETATEVADLAVDMLGFQAIHVVLARGDLFPDALAGGPHAGEEQAVIVLTADPATLGNATAAWLDTHSDTVATLHVLGGPNAIHDSTVAAARRAAGDTSA